MMNEIQEHSDLQKFGTFFFKKGQKKHLVPIFHSHASKSNLSGYKERKGMHGELAQKLCSTAHRGKEGGEDLLSNSSTHLNKQVILITLQLEHSSKYNFILDNINI